MTSCNIVLKTMELRIFTPKVVLVAHHQSWLSGVKLAAAAGMCCYC